MPDLPIVIPDTAAAPKDYTLSGTQELALKTVRALIDGSGAASAFLPTLQLLDPNGHVMWEGATTNVVAAGASADVSWFPGLGAGGGGGSGASLPVAFVDTSTQLTLTPWGGIYTAVTWTLFQTNDGTVFTWPGSGGATTVTLNTAGVYRCVYQYQVDGLNFPAAGNQILSLVNVTVVGSTRENLSLDATTGALYRGDPGVGTPWGAIGERVFNITTAQDVSVFVAYNGAGNVKLDTIVAFIYRIGDVL